MIVLGILGVGALFFWPAFRHDAWVEERLAVFDGYTALEWREVFEACAEFAESGKERGFSWGTESYGNLPLAIQKTEVRSVWVQPPNVSLRFSGGHFRYVHLEYCGEQDPPVLMMNAPSFFCGDVFPSEGSRPLSEREEVN